MTDDEMDYLLELIDEVRCVQYTSLWLFNPFVFNVSTRGNADALIALLVVSTIYSLMKGKYT
jgi:hypothetical protein